MSGSPMMILFRQLLADAHQFGEVCGGEFAQPLHQRAGVRQKPRLGVLSEQRLRLET